jgi:hypothetical protein
MLTALMVAHLQVAATRDSELRDLMERILAGPAGNQQA